LKPAFAGIEKVQAAKNAKVTKLSKLTRRRERRVDIERLRNRTGLKAHAEARAPRGVMDGIGKRGEVRSKEGRSKKYGCGTEWRAIQQKKNLTRRHGDTERGASAAGTVKK
jgi:hypothetical protein